MSSTRKFGITDSVSGLSNGLIANSISYTHSVESAEARNEKGAIIDIAAYSKSTEVSVDGVYVGDGIEPGTVVTIGDKSFLVTQSTHNQNNTSFQEGSIQARTADDAELWSLSAVQGQNS